ncbi:hypothetical protein NIES4103_55130 [Nostoc sp. NIES-4103]|nr:hypothetical protein NIES4103_55130 [Nostoc sp. NIES-4103]
MNRHYGFSLQPRLQQATQKASTVIILYSVAFQLHISCDAVTTSLL